jgi:hypothetical protein
MGAGRANRKEVSANARKQHSILADTAADHAAVGDRIDRHTLREIGPLGLGLLTHR